MERLKFAISKARDASIQLQLEQTRAGAGGASPPSAAGAGEPSKPMRRSWTLAALVLLGLAAMTALWAMKSSLVAAPVAAEGLADAALPLQSATITPSQVIEPVNTESPAVTVAVAPTARADTAPTPPNDQVEAAVEAWRIAWSTRNMKTYLGAYSESFKPRTDLSRAEWIASRHRNVGGRNSIDVQIKDLHVLALEDGRARVSFLQDYTSGSIREKEEPKTLDLVLDADARWRIVGEWQNDPPPFPGATESK